MPIQLAAFDMDGTLYNSRPMIHNVYIRAIDRLNDETGLNLNVPGHDEIMAQIGNPVRQIFLNLFPDLEKEALNRLSLIILEEVTNAVKNLEGTVYDHVHDVFQALHQKGIQTVICSNGRRPYLEAIIEISNIGKFIKPLETLNDLKFSHKGELLKYYIQREKSTPKSTIMIGDRKSDYDAAVYNDSHFILVQYGHRLSGEFHEGEDHLQTVHSLNEINDLID